MTGATAGSASTIPVVFVPAAPMMLEALNPTPTAEQSEVISASLSAVSRLAECRRIIVIGSHGMRRRPDLPEPAPGVRAVPLVDPRAATSPESATAPPALDSMPGSVLVGLELLSRAGCRGRTMAYVASGALDQWSQTADPWPHAAEPPPLAPGDGVLVVGDGTATRHEKAPGHVVAGAVELDARIAEMLGSGDVNGLLSLGPDLDERYLLDGRPAWQAAALLVRRSGGDVTSRLLGFFDPHHVAYFVAEWSVDMSSSQSSNAERIARPATVLE